MDSFFGLYDDEAIPIHMVKLIHENIFLFLWSSTARELWCDRKANVIN